MTGSTVVIDFVTVVFKVCLSDSLCQ